MGVSFSPQDTESGGDLNWRKEKTMDEQWLLRSGY